MLDLTRTRIARSVERPVAVGVTITDEGQPVVADSTGSVFGVKPCTNTAAEQFMGVSLSQQMTPLEFPKIEELTVSGLVVTTAKTPLAGTIRVYNVTKAAVVTAGGAAGNYGISGSTITIVTGGTTVNTDVLRVSYRYAPTTLEARSLQGDIPPGGAASLTLGTIGVIEEGDIYTTEYDTSVDWTANPVIVTLGASGVFTIGGTGTAHPGIRVINVPTSADPYLGLRIA